MDNRTGFSRAYPHCQMTNVRRQVGAASLDSCPVMFRTTNVHVNERDCIYEIRYDSSGRGRSSGLVAARLRPRRVAALRHRGRLLSRSRRGGGPLRSRRRVCSPSKPAWRPYVQQRRIWRSSRRRPQGMLPVLLKHLSVPNPCSAEVNTRSA